MATLVTAFMTNVNQIKFRSYEKYIELGKKLLKQPIPTVCFLERSIYCDFFEKEKHLYPETHFVFFEKQDNYLSHFEPHLTNYFVHTDNPEKDTPGYMFVQCHKTEWVKRAIEIDPFSTTDFIWVDFGIYHMLGNNDLEISLKLDEISRKQYSGVRIASCINSVEPNQGDIYHIISWFFAGSIFGGNKYKLLIFADLMKQFCIELMTHKKHIMWEINIWYLLYKEHKELFLPYMCNHDLSIIAHY
jgi:hypothetical protein